MARTAVPSVAQENDLSTVRTRIEEVLTDFLDARMRALDQVPHSDQLAHCVKDFVACGGKRLRPVLSVLGWQAAQPKRDVPAPVLKTAAALELFHAFALIHDDVMDDSDMRRGRPSVHRAMALRHEAADGPTPGRVGIGTAILAGDLALVWSDELLHTAGLQPAQLAAVLPLIDVMRTEIVCGQYLDLTAAGRPNATVEVALQVARYKTAKYTFERPLHVGAALAGADSELQTALSAYALPVGESFQLRDDLLGIFGDLRQTGKSVLEDLRDAKPTVLLATAREHATAGQQALLDQLVGQRDLDEEGATRVRRVLLETGAVNTVEAMITERHQQALQALDAAPITSHARTALRHLADAALWRST
ncbi:polyprenyl synthetase family protein [Streptomyces sp. NBC_00199]|uniref:polyprenyl synthetase family protein n=1 Tax=Streptomyces sp. NBC_00199 TaxID=2975678 RepID=UPI00225A403D|nr:polyprenyl synthetase family protein [Streptomyces sp. NBC_00199]MCX5265593.1 polyprenyl synthetase family protein [Streptomyces sp. NBC_00199]